jgi:hypothetical protein
LLERIANSLDQLGVGGLGNLNEFIGTDRLYGGKMAGYG